MRLIIIVIALVLALVAAFAVSGVLGKKDSEAPTVVGNTTVVAPTKVPETEILIAKRDIAIGQKLTSEDVESKSWPSHLMPPNALLSGVDITGQIASAPIVAQEPIMASKLRNPNDPGFLAGQLSEGMRAVTISVNLTDSVAGFVAPGDMVDIFYTFDLNKKSLDSGDLTSTSGGGESERISVTEVLMSNVKVLAVDQRVSAQVAASANPDEQGNQQQAGPAPIPTSVTLAASQKDAQKLRLAEKVGKLSLALRSLADTNKFEKVRPTAEQDLTRLLPPAYFPALFDSNADYDYNVVDIYNSKNTGKDEKPAKEDELPSDISVNIYRGSQLETVEVNRVKD